MDTDLTIESVNSCAGLALRHVSQAIAVAGIRMTQVKVKTCGSCSTRPSCGPGTAVNEATLADQKPIRTYASG
jgi:hypothetical protein